MLLGALALAACNDRSATAPSQGLRAICGSAEGYAVSLAPGEVATVSDPAQMACMVVPAQKGASEYVFIAANASAQPDVRLSYSVSSSGGATSAELVAAAAGSVRSPSLAPAPRASGFAERIEARWRAEERGLRLAAGRAVRRSGAARSGGGRLSVQAVVPAAGDRVSYRVPETLDACRKYVTVGARVRAVSEHAVIVEDTLAPANGFTDADFTGIASEFDRLIYPTDTLHFGSPGDLDGNGRVVVLYTPRVNAETPRGSDSYIAGFYFGGDLFPRSECAQSNLAEIFYVLTPDPSGQFGDVRSTAVVRQGTRGVIAHELQHMINLSVRIGENASQAEVTWLDEALAHFAEELVGRAERGYDDTRKLTITDVADRPRLDDFHAFFAQNLYRYQGWLERPDTAGATSAHADQSLAVRGAAWSLVRYAADQYAGGNVAAFTRRLAAGPDTGVANLVARTGATFAQIMAGWMPAHYTSGLTLAALPARATFLSWDMRSVESAVAGGSYPLAVTDLNAAASSTVTSPSAAGTFFRLSSTTATPTTTVRVRAADGTPLTSGGVNVYVVRTR